MERHTFVERSLFNGLDFGVEVNMGYLFGSRSGEMEDSFVEGDRGGVKSTGPIDVALGGGIAG
jgi:hypothetical protein